MQSTKGAQAFQASKDVDCCAELGVKIAKCKGCGAEIVWIKMHTGKLMPCDPDKQVFVVDGKDGGRVYKGYGSHWATCPKSKNFKKGR